jgi:hypothetical protein
MEDNAASEIKGALHSLMYHAAVNVVPAGRDDA